MVLSGVVPLLLEWTGLERFGVPSLFITKPPVFSGEREWSRPSPLKLAEVFFRPDLALAEIGRGGLLGEAGSDKGSEPVPTSASLMLIDRFFFGLDFFPAFSSFSFFFENFSSIFGVSSPPPPLLSPAFSSSSGVLSIILPLEFFLFSLLEDLESLLLAFLPLSLPSTILSPSPLLSETLEI